jgi:hypothetical protein
MNAPDRPVLPDLPHHQRNVFLMIRFRKTATHETITDILRSTLDDYGLNIVRADMRDYRDTLWENVELWMEACDTESRSSSR